MKMKLLEYAGPGGRVLILDTGGSPPGALERKLLCCRSLTLPVDALILGPLEPGPPFLAEVLDTEGLPRPMGRSESAAFAAFLRDAGYAGPGPVPVSDGTNTCTLPPEGDWCLAGAPEFAALLDL